MNNQPVKRRNPFETPKASGVTEEIKEPVIEEVKEEELFEVEPVEQVEEEPVYHKAPTKPVAKQPQKSSRSRYSEPEDENREKFTSTMDVRLRRKIKIVCAQRGIMFSSFIEEACREKLKREGE